MELLTWRMCCSVSRSRRRITFAPKPPVRASVSTTRIAPLFLLAWTMIGKIKYTFHPVSFQSLAMSMLVITDDCGDGITDHVENRKSISEENVLATLDLVPVHPFRDSVDLTPELIELGIIVRVVS